MTGQPPRVNECSVLRIDPKTWTEANAAFVARTLSELPPAGRIAPISIADADAGTKRWTAVRTA